MRSTKKMIVIGITIVFTMISMCGCGLMKSVSLTEDQTEQVAEYAANLLLSYDKSHVNGMVSQKRVADYEAAENVTDGENSEEVVDEDSSLDTADSETSDEENGAVEDGEEVVPEDASLSEDAQFTDASSGNGVSLVPIESALSLDGVKLEYSGYEFVQEYPPGDSDDLIFSLTATDNKKLLVVKYNMINEAADEVSVSNISVNKKVRASLNGTKNVRSQQTILLNDLSAVSTTLSGGESKEEVFVFEVDDNLPDNLDSLDITIISDDSNNTYSMIN